MQAGARKYRLAVLTKNRTNPAYAGARQGAERVAARWGATVTHYVPEKPDDIEQQHSLIKTALAAGTDALLLVPTHATALNATLRRAQADGILLVCIVGRPDEIACATFVGSDDLALARAIAGHLFASLGRRGDIVTLEGHPDSVTTASRTAGFRDAAGAAGSDVRIVASRAGNYQRDDGRSAMAELLATVPRIDGVLAANDFMALGAIDAMREAGRKLPIVGINATPEGVTAIKAGDMLASASFDAMKMACIGTEAAVRLLAGERIPQEIMLPVEVVDRSNCGAWDRPYGERALPEWSAYVKG
jgi:ribose transport system substrate-binding protein